MRLWCRDAKLSVLHWDAGRGELAPSSLHYFEGDASLKQGREVFPQAPLAVTGAVPWVPACDPIAAPALTRRGQHCIRGAAAINAAISATSTLPACCPLAWWLDVLGVQTLWGGAALWSCFATSWPSCLPWTPNFWPWALLGGRQRRGRLQPAGAPQQLPRLPQRCATVMWTTWASRGSKRWVPLHVPPHFACMFFWWCCTARMPGQTAPPTCVRCASTHSRVASACWLLCTSLGIPGRAPCPPHIPAGQVRDAVFLHGYNEPVLMLLHEAEPTWAGNLRQKVGARLLPARCRAAWIVAGTPHCTALH